MKVSFLIQDLFLQGAQYVTAMMVRGFIEKGYEVDLLLSQVHLDKGSKGDKPFEIPDSTNIVMMPSRRARYNIRSLHDYLQHTDSQAIISMCTPYLLPLAIATIGVTNKVKICYVEHNGFSPNLEKKSFLSKIQDRFIASRYDCFMGVSDGSSHLLERMLGLNEGTVTTVYNPVIDSLYWEKLSAQTTCDWLVNKSCTTIVAAGAFSPIKNHQMLFEAVKIANETTPIRLVLFGKGQLQSQYEEWIKSNCMQDKILLPGHTNNLPSEMKSADAFVVSSNLESFSVVIVEAMAANVPVLSTSCPFGPPELLHEGEYGALVPVGDAEAMAKALIKIANGDKNVAPKHAWEPFTLSNIVLAYEKAIKL